MQSSIAVTGAPSAGTGEEEQAAVHAASRDPAAFEVLYQRYRDRIYWYLRARTPSEDDAADLTQEVFLRTLDRLRQYRSRKGTFAAWLFGIARHDATDFHRRRKLTVEWEGLPPALHPLSGQNVENEVTSREALARLEQVLAGLPSETRELLALRFAGGLTIPEIATVIGKSPEATRKKLTRTLQAMEDRYHDPV
jgi:RNA polymerase sigma-70 factor (ECF subfamily)